MIAVRSDNATDPRSTSLKRIRAAEQQVHHGHDLTCGLTPKLPQICATSTSTTSTKNISKKKIMK